MLSNTAPVINPHIFRQYDVRGVVGRELTADFARSLGRAFGTLLRQELGDGGLRVALGRDNRHSSNELAAAVRDGLTATGIDVIDVATVPTPALYFASANLETDGAIQVTGSHNPPEYNGFKLSIRGRSIYGDAIQQLRSIMEAGEYAEGEGSVENREILSVYIDYVTRRFEVERPVTVVVDCG
ncbi:MAG TPA: phosphomannomutase/phosphoglucomutase, partial [Longimicrobiaceae bacterium]|nr:phosphomannomutase/phosphoglucomutase [Longimicrobiaceae bacterium]